MSHPDQGAAQPSPVAQASRPPQHSAGPAGATSTGQHRGAGRARWTAGPTWRDRRPPRQHARILHVGAALFGLQFLGACGFAAFLYHRDTLGIDFAHYSQAVYLISHGHLDPYQTIFNRPFIDNNFELVTWPLGGLFFVFRSVFGPSLFFMSVVQVACLVLAGAVAWHWIAEMLERHSRLSRSWSGAILLGALVVLLLDPSVYYSVALDFHFEAMATLFALLTARSLWRNQKGRALTWGAVTVLTGTLGGLYLAGVGLSGLLGGRRSRLVGLGFLVFGVIWIGLIGVLGANGGSSTQNYGYLAGRATLPAGFAAVVVLLKALLAHPGRFVHVLTSRLGVILRYLAWGGFLGFFSPWGFGVPALVMLTSVFKQSDNFIDSAWQQRAVIPFVAFGTASVLAVVIERMGPVESAATDGRSYRAERLVPGFLRHPGWALALAVVILVGAGTASTPEVRHALMGKTTAVDGFIPAGEAAAVRTILTRTPSRAEVIVSLPISGRFAEHQYLYLYNQTPPAPIPIKAKLVVLVLDTAHTLQLVSPTEDAAAIAYARAHFAARTLGSGPDVVAVAFRPPRGLHAVTLP